MSGESVLIVEDEGLIALHLSEILGGAGYQVRDIVNSGEAALADCGRLPLPDLVLMDIALVGHLDGIETARIIRRQHDIPVIFLTAYSDQSRIDEAQAVSPHGYLIKPLIAAELLAAIRQALRDKEP